MSAYLWVIIGTIAGPLFLSFDKKVAYYKYFSKVVYSIVLVSIPFLVCDYFFTKNEIWGFTREYILGIYLKNIPLEECLFFIIIPYACIFIYQVLKSYFPNYQGEKIAHYFSFTITFSGLLFGITFIEKWYTASACIVAALLTIKMYYIDKPKWFPNFVLTFIVALVPFIIVNGILTGAVTEKPIVWYSPEQIIGWRIITIPIEDLYYNYCLLLPIVYIFERKMAPNRKN